GAGAACTGGLRVTVMRASRIPVRTSMEPPGHSMHTFPCVRRVHTRVLFSPYERAGVAPCGRDPAHARHVPQKRARYVHGRTRTPEGGTDLLGPPPYSPWDTRPHGDASSGGCPR